MPKGKYGKHKLVPNEWLSQRLQHVKRLIHPQLAEYFFGPEFKVDVAEHALAATTEGRALFDELVDATEKRKPHSGLQLTCCTNLDTGLFMAILQARPGAPSMISHYVSSNHRYFGGQTLLCVPFQFCSWSTPLEGEYTVYRHTYKEPILAESDVNRILTTGNADERMKTFVLLRSRDGYRTIPGKSYVGMTRRHHAKRYVEHIETALAGASSALFHQAIREMEGKRVICVHDVSAFALPEAAAKSYERHLISTSTLSPKGLNMKIG